MVKAVKMITIPRPEMRGRSFSSDEEKKSRYVLGYSCG
jgi:hypothetical protein